MIAVATIAAVSARNMRGPNVTGIMPAEIASMISPSVNPPSGPIKIPMPDREGSADSAVNPARAVVKFLSFSFSQDMSERSFTPAA